MLVQLSIDPLQASLAAPGASIRNAQQSPSRSECFIAAMKHSLAKMKSSIDRVQPSTVDVRMAAPRAGGRPGPGRVRSAVGPEERGRRGPG